MLEKGATSWTPAVPWKVRHPEPSLLRNWPVLVNSQPPFTSAQGAIRTEGPPTRHSWVPALASEPSAPMVHTPSDLAAASRHGRRATWGPVHDRPAHRDKGIGAADVDGALASRACHAHLFFRCNAAHQEEAGRQRRLRKRACCQAGAQTSKVKRKPHGAGTGASTARCGETAAATNCRLDMSRGEHTV